VAGPGAGAILVPVTGSDRDSTTALDQTAPDQTPSDQTAPDQTPADQTTVAVAVAAAALGTAPPAHLRPARPGPTRAAGAGTGRWSRRPRGRFLLPAVALVLLLGAAVTAGGYLVPATAPVSPHTTPPGAAGAVAAGAPPSQAPAGVDPGAAAQPTASGAPAAAPTTAPRPPDTLAVWARRMSPVVGIPVVALQAYGYAQLRAQQTLPGCHLMWTTLAGIGKVESNHGSAQNAHLQTDGRVLPPIIGAALDGTGGTSLVRDTDHGTLDGDPSYDRAVGPMQFIPGTWAKYQVDADQDGVADPNDINDAALAAADYLCAVGGDLSVGASWWTAVLGYNAVQAYARNVFDAANDYGLRSKTVA
jgi:membrane-bound lytic murein transglycosylase B